MSGDLVDSVFGAETDEQFYPGSRRKRREALNIVKDEVDPWRNNYYLKTIKGREQKMYTIGSMAQALGVSVMGVRKWIKYGRIPKAPYRLPSTMVVNGEPAEGRRLYTESLIDAVVEVFRKNGILGKPRIMWDRHENVPVEIYEAWTRILNESSQLDDEFLDEDFITDYTK